MKLYMLITQIYRTRRHKMKGIILPEVPAQGFIR